MSVKIHYEITWSFQVKERKLIIESRTFDLVCQAGQNPYQQQQQK